MGYFVVTSQAIGSIVRWCCPRSEGEHYPSSRFYRSLSPLGRSRWSSPEARIPVSQPALPSWARPSRGP